MQQLVFLAQKREFSIMSIKIKGSPFIVLFNVSNPFDAVDSRLFSLKQHLEFENRIDLCDLITLRIYTNRTRNDILMRA